MLFLSVAPWRLRRGRHFGVFFAALGAVGCFGLVENDATIGAGTDRGVGGTGSGGNGESPCLACATWTLSLLSRSPAGGPGAGDSYGARVCGNGRSVAFISKAANLVTGDNNGVGDVLVLDRTKSTISRVVGEGGVEPDGDSWEVDLTRDGALVVFASDATNLVAGDENGFRDIFLASSFVVQRLVTVGLDGSPANGPSGYPRISADGSSIVFVSEASNLVADDDNGVADAFHYDVSSGVVSLVSLGSDGRQGTEPVVSRVGISGNGRLVAFSTASSLVPEDANGALDAYVRDMSVGSIRLVSRLRDGGSPASDSAGLSLSAAGDRLAFASDASEFATDDTNGVGDVFVAEVPVGAISLESRSSSGDLSRWSSGAPTLSGFGNLLVFESLATEFAPNSEWVGGLGGPSIFARELGRRETWLVDRGSDGLRADGVSQRPTVSDDGTVIVFESRGRNLEGAGSGMQIYISVAEPAN